MMRREETICAPATGTGGAIAIIRMSGSLSLEICSKIFYPLNRKIKIPDNKGFKVIYGDVRSGNEIVDDVLVTIFRAPASFTGEDSVEISCHASPFIQRRIIELLIANGAVAALPGEFTQRAFYNGKMDLSQAEAVADVVASTTRSAHRVALTQMRGGISGEIARLRNELLHFASMIELELDFGEEDVEFADRNELHSIIVSAITLSDNLAGSFQLGNAIRNGIPVAIVGKPNSGKSTLLNSILKEEKAIVSEIPGTTRDIIEDTIVLDGISYRFIDTAGLRDTNDLIEKLGIRKTHEKIDQASVVLLVDEAGDNFESINSRIIMIRNLIAGTGKKLFILINKTDLIDNSSREVLEKRITQEEYEELLFISAKEGYGLDLLRDRLGSIVEKEKLNSEDVIITNIRHYEALKKVSESLLRVDEGLMNKIPEDLLAMDIRQAIHYLGEITGEITSDEILGNIFRHFCIGK